MECSNCQQMKAENKQLRKNRDDIHKNYVEVCNENLALRKELNQRSKDHDAVSKTNNAEQ